MTDIMIYESGGGGEIFVKGSDIETTDGIFNQPYLSHFGGNVEASTTGDEKEGIERFDWWGNSFLEGKNQMNSALEKALNDNALNSSGRVNIEKAANKDLDHLKDIAEVSSAVSIIGVDKVLISDKINKTVINFIWDATKNELIEERII